MPMLFGMSVWTLLNKLGTLAKIVSTIVSLAFSMKSLAGGRQAYGMY